MRSAYALLGLAFIIVFGGAFILFKESAEAPTSINQIAEEQESTMSLSLTSPVFSDGETIPEKYSCDGENINPPLSISGVPEETEALVLLMDDPDIPEEIKASRGIEKFDHWVLYNLPADTTSVEEGSVIGTAGANGRGESAYTGPCPPPDMEPTTHRYFFRLYALRSPVNFIKTPTLDEVEAAVRDITIESAELMGVYSRAETTE